MEGEQGFAWLAARAEALAAKAREMQCPAGTVAAAAALAAQVREAGGEAAVAADPRPALDLKSAELAAKQCKELLMLGALGELQRLQEEWDPADFEPGAEMPYDPLPGGGPKGKTYESLSSFLRHEKGLAPVIAISSGCKVGPALLESLLRTLEAAPAGAEFGALGLGGLDEVLAKPGACKADRSDLEITQQMLLNRKQRSLHGLNGEDRCGGRDLAVLKLMTDHSWPGAAARLERWGLAAAQMFIDYLRSIGEFAMRHNWEKKTSLDEHLVRTAIRCIGASHGRRVSEATLGDIRRRTLP